MMIDSLGNIIYVGKAKKLKNRVSQYFRNQKDRAPQIEEMIHNIHTINYRVTDTELDREGHDYPVRKQLNDSQMIMIIKYT